MQALRESFEEVLLDRGMAQADTALLAQQAFGAQIEHARYLTVHDLLAIIAMQYQNQGLQRLWPVIETALLAPDSEEWLDAPPEPLLRYAEGGVQIAMLDPNAWQQRHAGHVQEMCIRDSTLRGRGANLLRADVYARIPVAISAVALNRLRTLDAPAALALSSGAALERVLGLLPADVMQQLQAMPVAAASPRLLQAARQAGFNAVELAQGPMPRQLLAALAPRFR